MKLIRSLVILLALFSGISFALEDRNPDIPPRKGDITKNIHILFDKSGSMKISDFELAYAEIENILMVNTDEFNLAVTVFASESVRMGINDPDCKVGKNWMAMPSVVHYNNTLKWLKETRVRDKDTRMLSSIKAILEENKENVTVIVISDCIIDDDIYTLGFIQKAIKGGKNPIKIGFVSTGRYMSMASYDRIKDSGCWFVKVRKKD